MTMKALVWRLTPAFTHRWLRNLYFTLKLLPESWYDYRRYLRLSGINRSRGYRGEQAARITMAYHQLEKGLSLAAPRPGFGRDNAERLLKLLGPYVNHFGPVAPVTTALTVLTRYVEFNRQAGVDVSKLAQAVDKMRAQTGTEVPEGQPGGAIEIRRAELEGLRGSGFHDFFNSRYSVRHFSGGPIPEDDLVKAIRLSQKTPSVCNRQAWRVHAYSDRSEMARLLAIQDGNRGFGDQASLLLLVTCDLTAFVEVEERYQAWIDGGMFCMSLCLAFHDLGYGTCCLNWSKRATDDKRLRSATSIPNEEQVIMMIAVGTLPDTFRVASSPRLDLGDVLHIHRGDNAVKV